MSAMQPIRARRKGEEGQVLVLFLLIFVTLVLFSVVAVSVGQMLVRRHQAQMVVDAAAFSAAAEQAKGMNTIAYINEGELNLLDAIYATKFIPYMDGSGTSWERWALGAISLPINEWAGDTIEKYNDLFKIMNKVIDGVNLAYSPMLVPRSAAREIVDENFGDDADKLFKSDDLLDQGVLIDPPRLTEVTKLVKLTDPESYTINGQYTYIPMPTSGVFADSGACPFCPVTAKTGEAYGEVNLAINAYRLAEPFDYDAGRFYDNDEGKDVRFAYYLKVSTAPVLFGKTFFREIPSIIVAAAAKPYGGYLGDEFSGNRWWPYSNASGKDISYTYKAKLVPLTRGELAELAIHSDDMFDNAWRYPASAFH